MTARYASILRSREWHERRTAAGKCHRCPRKVEQEGWYCRQCRIDLSQQKAFVRFVTLVANDRCPECGKPNHGKGLTHKHCRRRKVLNSSGYYRRSSDRSDAARPPMEDLRPLFSEHD